MHEALDQFIHAHYTEILAVLPMALFLIGLWIAVGIDQYLLKQKKRIMLIICALVFSLIAQNFLDNWLTFGAPRITLRKAIDIYGYAIRPVILLLFLYIVSPRRPNRLWWALIGLNAGLHLTALFTDIFFTIDENNRFQGGWPVLRNSCLIVSVVLLGALFFSMGITDALAEKVASHSHGMKQKLAIVAALMHEPKLLIMDEPFVGLDPKAAFILKKFMRSFCDNGGAIFFSTHVLDVAEKLCDKIAIIRGGKLLANGDMETVKGNESLEEVFPELVDDIKVEEDAAQEGEKHA